MVETLLKACGPQRHSVGDAKMPVSPPFPPPLPTSELRVCQCLFVLQIGLIMEILIIQLSFASSLSFLFVSLYLPEFVFFFWCVCVCFQV